MRSLLALGLFAVPVPFVSPAEAQTLAPCCQPQGEWQHPDPRNPGPIFVPAEVRRPNERALEAAAEAPITVRAPLANAIGIPLPEEEEAVAPEREPERAPIFDTPPLRVDSGSLPAPDGVLTAMPPCCQMVESETRPPEGDPKEGPSTLIRAKVENRRKERLLTMAAEVPIPEGSLRVNAIGVPLEADRGVSEPEHRSLPVDALWRWMRNLEARAEIILPMLLLLLAIGLWLRWRRRPAAVENQPVPQRPELPDELLQPHLAPVSFSEPTRATAKEPRLELA